GRGKGAEATCPPLERALSGDRALQRLRQRGHAPLVEPTEKLQRDVQILGRRPRHVRDVRTQAFGGRRELLPDIIRQQQRDEEATVCYRGVSSRRIRSAIAARRAAS